MFVSLCGNFIYVLKYIYEVIVSSFSVLVSLLVTLFRLASERLDLPAALPLLPLRRRYPA